MNRREKCNIRYTDGYIIPWICGLFLCMYICQFANLPTPYCWWKRILHQLRIPVFHVCHVPTLDSMCIMCGLMEWAEASGRLMGFHYSGWCESRLWWSHELHHLQWDGQDSLSGRDPAQCMSPNSTPTEFQVGNHENSCVSYRQGASESMRVIPWLRVPAVRCGGHRGFRSGEATANGCEVVIQHGKTKASGKNLLCRRPKPLLSSLFFFGGKGFSIVFPKVLWVLLSKSHAFLELFFLLSCHYVRVFDGLRFKRPQCNKSYGPKKWLRSASSGSLCQKGLQASSTTSGCGLPLWRCQNGDVFGKGELEEVNAMQKKSQDEPH